MANDFNRGVWGVNRAGAMDQAVVDQALRSYLLRVYNMMASGLLVSGIVAVAVSMSPAAMAAIFGNPLLRITVTFAPLGLILWMSFGINRISASTLQILYWAFVTTLGVSLSTVFLMYRLGSVVEVFFVTAATFGALSLYGYTTKRDLTGFGTFLFMGLIGIILASLVNLFVQSSGAAFIISILGVLIFTGLTAYDTQRLKNDFYEGNPAEVIEKQAIMGAVQLYLDFVNIFLLLLRILGDRR
ncbi:MAG TPA: Bax inhibitor-1/YccA family protein [Candidatus Cybelea sp.]|nr:Bax inhibitor-1/YccA family protein [Candidatus Cybelea sp.]